MSFSGMPASAQHIPKREELGSDRPWDLSLYACPDCGLLQFDCEPVDYYRDVIRAVGLSETMRELRRRDYRYLTEELSLSGGRFIECGCGRGEFLEVLKEFPVSIYGTEADKSNAEAAARLLNEDRGGKDQGKQSNNYSLHYSSSTHLKRMEIICSYPNGSSVISSCRTSVVGSARRSKNSLLAESCTSNFSPL